MDKWSMNAIMWNIERTSNIIVFDDLVLPQVNFAELGCISMIQNFIAYLAYDENFDAAYSYGVMTRFLGSTTVMVATAAEDIILLQKTGN